MLCGAGVQYDVFVSHRGLDFKQTLVSWIEKEFGHSRLLFIDNVSMNPATGGIGWHEIMNALRSAKVVLIILSQGFQESPYCLEEMRIAVTERPDAVRILCYDIKPGHINEKALQRASQISQKAGAFFENTEVENWKVALKRAGEITSWIYERKRSDSWLQ